MFGRPPGNSTAPMERCDLATVLVHHLKRHPRRKPLGVGTTLPTFPFAMDSLRRSTSIKRPSFRSAARLTLSVVGLARRAAQAAKKPFEKKESVYFCLLLQSSILIVRDWAIGNAIQPITAASSTLSVCRSKRMVSRMLGRKLRTSNRLSALNAFHFRVAIRTRRWLRVTTVTTTPKQRVPLSPPTTLPHLYCPRSSGERS